MHRGSVATFPRGSALLRSRDSDGAKLLGANVYEQTRVKRGGGRFILAEERIYIPE